MENIKKSKRTKKLLKVAFACVYSIIAAEFFLRIFHPIPILPRYVSSTPYGIRGNEPNRSYWHRTPEYKVHIQTNSKGIRADKEIPYEKPDGIKRIVVLGDSFGLGYGVNEEDMFLTQIHDVLTNNGIANEIVNLSVSGYGTAEQLIILKEEGLKYDPDLILVAWHASDLYDNPRSGLYQYQDDELIRTGQTYLPGVKTREFLFQFAAYRFIAGNSHLYNWMREKAARSAKDLILALKKSNKKEAPQVSPDQEIPNVEPHKLLTVKLLSEIQNVAHAHHAEILVLDIPVETARTKFHSQFPYDYLENEDFTIFSPLEAFKENLGPKLYWERSMRHFTPLGCELVGKGLADVILQNSLLHRDVALSQDPCQSNN